MILPMSERMFLTRKHPYYSLDKKTWFFVDRTTNFGYDVICKKVDSNFTITNEEFQVPSICFMNKGMGVTGPWEQYGKVDGGSMIGMLGSE